MVMPSTRICSKIASSLLFSLLCLLLLSGCTSFEYDPPPGVSIVFPDAGVYTAGDAVELLFSEGINQDTLKVRIWQTGLNEEQEIPADAEPVIASCALTQKTCGDLTLEPIQTERDITGVRLLLKPEGLGAPGLPIIIEVLSGLEDEQGHPTGVSAFYDIQFRDPNGRFNDEPVLFKDGTYIFSAVVQKPIPAVLTLISDVKVLPDGRIFLAGGEGDEINGAPKTTVDPDNLIVDPTDQGWAAHIQGFIKLRDGRRFLETDPIDIRLPITPLQVRLEKTRLTAEIITDAQGNDQFEGTLSFEKLVVVNGSKEIEQKGGGEALVGYFVPPSKTPEGTPELCGNLCGAIIGLCDVPEGFPAQDVCEAPENP